MDEKNTCDGRRTDQSCLDYQGVNDFQDANSVMCVHDPILEMSSVQFPRDRVLWILSNSGIVGLVTGSITFK